MAGALAADLQGIQESIRGYEGMIQSYQAMSESRRNQLALLQDAYAKAGNEAAAQAFRGECGVDGTRGQDGRDRQPVEGAGTQPDHLALQIPRHLRR